MGGPGSGRKKGSANKAKTERQNPRNAYLKKKGPANRISYMAKHPSLIGSAVRTKSASRKEIKTAIRSIRHSKG